MSLVLSLFVTYFVTNLFSQAHIDLSLRNLQKFIILLLSGILRGLRRNHGEGFVKSWKAAECRYSLFQKSDRCFYGRNEALLQTMKWCSFLAYHQKQL